MDRQLDSFIEKVMVKINHNLSSLLEKTATPNEREAFIAISLPIHHALKIWERRTATLAQNTNGVDSQMEMAKLRRKLTYILKDRFLNLLMNGENSFPSTLPMQVIEADVIYVDVNPLPLDEEGDNLNPQTADALLHYEHNSELFSGATTNQIKEFYRLRNRFDLSGNITLEIYGVCASILDSKIVRFSQHDVLDGPFENLLSSLLHSADCIMYAYQNQYYPQWLRYGVYGLQVLSNILLLTCLVIVGYFLKAGLMILGLGLVNSYLLIRFHLEILDKNILYSEVEKTLSDEQMGDFYQRYLKEDLLLTTEDIRCTNEVARTTIEQLSSEQHKRLFKKKKLEFLQAHYQHVWGIQYLKILLDTIYTQLTTSNPNSLFQWSYNLFLWVWAVPMLGLELVTQPIQLLGYELLSVFLPLLFWTKAILTLLSVIPLLVYECCYPSQIPQEEAPNTINQVKDFLSLTLWKTPAEPFEVGTLANDAWLSNPQIMRL